MDQSKLPKSMNDMELPNRRKLARAAVSQRAIGQP
jgi:hypothetical protein